MSNHLNTRLIPEGLIPERLKLNYSAIRLSSLYKEKNLSEEQVSKFEQLLNDSQPQNNDEELTKRLVYNYLFKANPAECYKFFMKAKLFHLVLWLDSKTIVKHFGLRGRLFIKWDRGNYKCSIYLPKTSENSGGFRKNEYYNEDGDLERPPPLTVLSVGGFPTNSTTV